MYIAAMGGAFRLIDDPWVFKHRGHQWQRFMSYRTQRRTNRTTAKSTHDYQRIALDFGGSVAFPSDQGLFVVPIDGSCSVNDTACTFITANGNLCIPLRDGTNRLGASWP